MHANPIVTKELRSRMRGPRAFVILTGFLLVLGLFTYGLYRILTFTQGLTMGGAPMGAVVGRSIFLSLAFFELLLVCLIAPALTAGGISGEAERRTLDMLLATPLRPAAVLWGKLLSALTYVFLLVLAAVPLVSIVFILGGVTFADMGRALAILVLCAMTFGTLGLWASAAIRRTGRSMVLSYAVVLLLIGGTYFVYVVLTVLSQGAAPRWLLFANPVAAMASAVAGDMTPDTMGALSSMGGLTPLLWLLGGGAFRSAFGGVPDPSGATITLRPLWHYTAGLYLLATVVLFALAVQWLRPIRRWQVGRKGTIAAVASAVLLVLLAYGFYGPPSYARFGQPLAPPVDPAAAAAMQARLSSRAVAAPAMAVAAPAMEVAVAVTAEPAPTATAFAPTDFGPSQVGAMYATAVTWLLKNIPPRDGEVKIVDTAGGGLLAGLGVDPAKPQPLETEALEPILRAVKSLHPGGASAAGAGDVQSEERLAESGTLIRLGVLNFEGGGRVLVPVARYDSPNDASARVLTLQMQGDAWAVVESGEEVKR